MYVREIGISSWSILITNWNVSMWVTRSMLMTKFRLTRTKSSWGSLSSKSFKLALTLYFRSPT